LEIHHAEPASCGDSSVATATNPSPLQSLPLVAVAQGSQWISLGTSGGSKARKPNNTTPGGGDYRD
jgi:hypothetical protein